METIKVVIYNAKPMHYAAWKGMEKAEGEKAALHFVRYEEGVQFSQKVTGEQLVLLVYQGEDARPTWSFIREMKKNHPGLPILLLARTHSVHTLYRAVQYGLEGLLTEQDTLEAALRALQMLAQGEKYFNSSAIIEMAQWDKSVLERDLEILLMSAKEYDRAAMAKALNVGLRTLDSYLIDLRRRLGVRSVVGLAMYAQRVGLV